MTSKFFPLIYASLFLFAKSAFFPQDNAEWPGTHARGQNCSVESESPQVPPPCHHPTLARPPPSSRWAPTTPPVQACLSEPSDAPIALASRPELLTLDPAGVTQGCSDS